MRRRIFMLGLIGAPIGLAISTSITIFVSLCINDGYYYPVAPELIAVCGTEINAILLQTICSLLYGAVFAVASIIWEMERWSILRQTATHLIVCSLATFPAAYFMYWMPHSISGAFTYFGINFAIYFVIWITQYIAAKKRIERINTEIQKIGN